MTAMSSIHLNAFLGNAIELEKAIESYRAMTTATAPQELPEMLIAQDEEKMTPLHHAIQSGSVECVQLLLDSGVPVDLPDGNCFTPLAFSCMRGRSDITAILLRCGAQIDRPHTGDWLGGNNADGMLLNTTALHLACLFAESTNHIECVRLLLNARANPRASSQDGCTPLHFCGLSPVDKQSSNAAHIKAECVRILLVHGASPKDLNAIGRTPLHNSCYTDLLEVSRCLIDAGAPIDHIDSRGMSALDCASRSCCTLLIQCALSGAKLALHRACFDGKHEFLAMLLQANVYRIDELNKQGLTPLSVACRRGHHSCVELLLSHNAPVTSDSKGTEGPLHHACFSGSVECANALLRAGARLDATTDLNVLPLHLACSRNKHPCLRLLIEHHSPIPSSALSVACHNGALECVSLLLDEGGVSIDSNEGAALLSACRGGHLSCTKLLLERGIRINLELLKQCTKAITPHPHAIQFTIPLASAAIVSASRHGDSKCLEWLLGFSFSCLPFDEALSSAAAGGHHECVRLLVEHSQENHFLKEERLIEAPEPLLHACERGAMRSVRILLDAGARADMADTLGAALKAPRGVRSRLLALLLSHGAQPSLPLEKCDPTLLRLIIRREGLKDPTREDFVEAVLRAAAVANTEGLHEQLRMLVDAIDPPLSPQEEARVAQVSPQVGARIALERAQRERAEEARIIAKKESEAARKKAIEAAEAAQREANARDKAKSKARRAAACADPPPRPIRSSRDNVVADRAVTLSVSQPDGKRIAQRAESRQRAWEHAQRKREAKLVAMAEEEWRLHMLKIGEAIARGE